MNFKSLFFTLSLLFSLTFTLSATPAVPLVEGVINTETVELATHAIAFDNYEVVFDDAECTVTATISAGGIAELEVSATAATCAEALQMILDIVEL